MSKPFRFLLSLPLLLSSTFAAASDIASTATVAAPVAAAPAAGVAAVAEAEPAAATQAPLPTATDAPPVAAVKAEVAATTATADAGSKADASQQEKKPAPALPAEPAPTEDSAETPATAPARAENVDLRDVVAPVIDAGTPATAPAAASAEGEVVDGTPLILLGTEVPPGTATRLAWSPIESFAGIAAPTPVLVVNGARPGPVLCLTAAIHGDELVGIEVVRRMLYSVDAKQLSGALIGVPIVNLQGFRRSSRYLPDRRDLNRFFPGNTHGSSAARIAHSFFNEVVLKCDALVDLHTGSFHRTNLPQVRGDLNNPDVASLAKGFGATVVLQSRGSRGMLRRAAVDVGIPAVTLEAGEPLRLDEQPVVQGVRSIEHLLDSLGMLPMRGRFARREQPVFYKSTWVRANEGGVLSSKVKLGQTVKVGDLLGTVIDPITNAQHDIVSPHAGRIIGMALNQVMMPGFAAYHIGIQSTVEEAATPDPTLDTAVDELDDEDAGPIPEAAAPSGAPSAAPAERVPDDTE